MAKTRDWVDSRSTSAKKKEGAVISRALDAIPPRPHSVYQRHLLSKKISLFNHLFLRSILPLRLLRLFKASVIHWTTPIPECTTNIALLAFHSFVDLIILRRILWPGNNVDMNMRY